MFWGLFLLESIVLVIFFYQYSAHSLGFTGAAFGQPFLDHGSDPAREEFYMVWQVGVVAEILTPHLAWLVLQEGLLEVKAHLEIQSIENLVFLDAGKQLCEVHAVGDIINFFLKEGVQKFIHHVIFNGVFQIGDVKVNAVEGGPVDTALFTYVRDSNGINVTA